jgi:hypothetical protein
MAARNSLRSLEDKEKQIAFCSKCKVWKSFPEFSMSGRYSGGVGRQTVSSCKECQCKWARDKAKKRRDEYSADELAAGSKKCNFCHNEKPLEQFKKYAGSHYVTVHSTVCMDCHREKMRAKYRKNNDRMKVLNAKYYRIPERRVAKIFQNLKNRAKHAGLEFDLDLDWFKERFSNGCEITGIAFEIETDRFHKNLFGPSVDRTDSDKGYTKDNCKLVCLCYNLAKNCGTHQDVVKMAKALIDREPGVTAGAFTDRFIDKWN